MFSVFDYQYGREINLKLGKACMIRTDVEFISASVIEFHKPDAGLRSEVSVHLD